MTGVFGTCMIDRLGAALRFDAAASALPYAGVATLSDGTMLGMMHGQ